MRHPAQLGALILVALVAAVPARAATCTQAEKDAAVAALASYQKKLPKERAAYFRKHKSAKLRKAFVKKQQAKLKRRRDAAGCEVPPPPTPPPPPAETIPPTLTRATAAGATVTLVFDEPIASIADVSVTISGSAVTATSSVSGASVTLTLGTSVDAGSEILVNGKVRDLVGNETTLGSQAVTNTMAAAASPTLQKSVNDSGFPAPD